MSAMNKSNNTKFNNTKLKNTIKPHCAVCQSAGKPEEVYKVILYAKVRIQKAK